MPISKNKNIRKNRTILIVLGFAGLSMVGVGILLFINQQTKPEPSIVHISFNAFPDGTPITGDRILRGNEFLDVGIRLAGAPEGKYCTGATATAIRQGGRYGNISFPFLTAAQPNGIDICNSSPVEITFTKPVREVTLVFAGASQKYNLNVYGKNSNLIGSSQVESVFNQGTFEANFRSEHSDISRVTFGAPLSLTAIKEIVYER